MLHGSQLVYSVVFRAISGASSYEIFRSTVAGGPYSFVGFSTDTSYVDSPPSPAQYFWVVRAFDAAMVPLAVSDEASAFAG